ncbi:MAG: FAD:protein FMN transferase [Acidobacteriota bacterium]
MIAQRLRRARPLLGTIVDIQAWGLPRADLVRAVERAFRAVTRVHESMSAHDAGSDVARINGSAPGAAVPVGRATFEVLAAAVRLSRETRGAFDPTVAPLLARWGYLPHGARSRAARSCGAIDLVPPRTVVLRRRVAIDLGGIAKGYAVDRAVASLRRSRVAGAVVNAGGDVRIAGTEPRVIHVPLPRHRGRMALAIPLRNAAIATSAAYRSIRVVGGRRVSHLVDPQKRSPILTRASVSVVAPTCLLADALTKAVMVDGDGARPALRRHGATAFVVNLRGEWRAIG